MWLNKNLSVNNEKSRLMTRHVLQCIMITFKSEQVSVLSTLLAIQKWLIVSTGAIVSHQVNECSNLFSLPLHMWCQIYVDIKRPGVKLDPETPKQQGH